MNRRALLAGTGTVGILGLSGCLGLLPGDLTSFEAQPADVSQSVLSDTGYEDGGVDEIVNEETFEAAGQSETVVVTSYLSEYTKSIDLGPLGERESALFAVLATPKVEVLGQTFNPVGDMSTEELVDLIAENYDELGDIEFEEDTTTTILTQTVTESLFVAEASIDGQLVDLSLHITEAAERGDDFVVTIGAYPQQLEGEERPNIRSLIEAVTPIDDADEEDADDSDGDEQTDDEDNGGDDDNDDGEEEDSDSEDNDDGEEEGDDNGLI